ncbi:hypothetical protein PR048_022205, partial [Dryococelus australis]
MLLKICHRSSIFLRYSAYKTFIVRYIYITKSWEHISSYYEKLEWLTIDDRRKLHTLILKSDGPKYLADRFQSLNVNHNPHTRSCETSKLIILYHKSNLFSQSFTVSSARIWNDLPSNLKYYPN